MPKVRKHPRRVRDFSAVEPERALFRYDLEDEISRGSGYVPGWLNLWNIYTENPEAFKSFIQTYGWTETQHKDANTTIFINKSSKTKITISYPEKKVTIKEEPVPSLVYEDYLTFQTDIDAEEFAMKQIFSRIKEGNRKGLKV